MKKTAIVLALSAALLFTHAILRAQQDDSQPSVNSSFTLKVNSDLVLTNIVVRDKKTGQVVQGLTQKDFTVLENGKPQQIATFDFENVEQVAQLNEATVSGRAGAPIVLGKTGTAAPAELRDHRLVVLFFDITSMQPEDLERAQEAARNYVNKQMQAADLVSVVSLDSSLSLDQDFTQNKQLLLKAIASYSGTQGEGYGAGATSTTNQTEDASSYTPDESEYNDVNTDRELYAISSISKSLAYINQKKSLLYFSGGIQRDGIENQASLRAATNAAVRANLSIYSVDTRGLQAISPLGDASTGSLRGTSSYSGAAAQNNFDANFNTQEVMATLSSDTGGKAFFDSNDFSPAFQRMQQDTSAYYVIGFRSSDMRRDGRYRKLQIKVDRADVKLEYRPGYYAPADFKHSNKEDRERELQEELASDLPATDVSVYLQALYFRLDDTRYYIPISIIVPGSQIPFVKGGDRDKATIDVIGEVKDAAGHDIGDARQTVKLAIDQAQQVQRKNVQYSTGFTLPPGKYHLKFVVRENETGRMGSFETDITVPDLRKAPLKLSSVVLASQRVPDADKNSGNPLVRDGMQLIPNLAHVFQQGQHLYFLYEVYDPTHVTGTNKPDKSSNAPVRVLTSIEFLSNNAKVYETPLVEATHINVPGHDAVVFQFDVPVAQLKAGLYTCQVNVIDDAGGSFGFPRVALLVRSSGIVPAPNATGSGTPSGH